MTMVWKRSLASMDGIRPFKEAQTPAALQWQSQKMRRGNISGAASAQSNHLIRLFREALEAPFNIVKECIQCRWPCHNNWASLATYSAVCVISSFSQSDICYTVRAPLPGPVCRVPFLHWNGCFQLFYHNEILNNHRRCDFAKVIVGFS